MASLTRPAVSLRWAGRDVTAQVGPLVEEVAFTDALQAGEGTADELQVTLSNADGRWYETWWPTEGDTLEATIQWEEDGRAKSFPLGTFYIDSRGWRFAAHTVQIRASSLPPGEGETPAGERRDRAWEKTRLRTVVQQLAGEAGLTLIWEGRDLALDRIDQRAETGHQLLARLAKTYSAALAYKGQSLLWTDQLQHAVVHPIDIGAGSILDGDITLAAARKTKGTGQDKGCGPTGYAAVEIRYYDALKKETVVYVARASGATGPTLRLREQARDLDDARRRAEAQLGKGGRACDGGGGDAKATAGANADAGGRGNLTLVGRPIAAGDIARLSGAGKLSGDWRVIRAVHTVSGRAGWTTRLQIESSDYR
jgi:uncharacterized protein